MAKALSNAFSPIRRIINEDYKPADESYPMGGTVVPSVVTEDPELSGVRFPVHAEKMTGCNLVQIDKAGNVKTIPVSARAMEILREGNKDGKHMGYDEAIKLAEAQEEVEKKSETEKQALEEAIEQDNLQKLAPVVPPVIGVDLAKPGTRDCPAVPAQNGMPSNVEPDYMKAQRAEKPVKKGRKGKVQAQPAQAPRIAVSFSSRMGVMSIMAERVFIGGPNGICLVIIQYSPEGHFFIPPQLDEPITISFQGNVYKCLTGIYYQIPGTPVMHTVYFIAKE